ncbi:MAG TPA: alpha/beta hydrolase [Acidimicrobiales bacterium]|nr:alpha/beta hydrolase [Acidimicrobiales bacterium]
MKGFTMKKRSIAALGLATVAAGAVVAAERRWTRADDPSWAADSLLPAGTNLAVATDDGASIAVTVMGSGADVVLAHGWTNARQVWAPVANRLVASGHRVIAYDQRGHGSSTVGTDGFTIPRLGADMQAVLEAVDARDAVLAGHSMGGMTIQSLVTHQPAVVDERATAIGLIAPAASGVGRRDIGPAAGRILVSKVLDRAMRTRAGLSLVRGTIGKVATLNHLTLTRDLFVATPAATRLGWFNAMQTMDLREGIASIDIPVTVLVGTRDQLTPLDRATELVDTIPGAKLVTFDGLGHMLPLEAPDEVARAIEQAAV